MTRIVCGIILPLAALCIWRGGAAADDNDWGTVKGRVAWGAKDLPIRKPLDKIKESNDKDHCLSKGNILDEEWVVNKDNRGIRWTFVWLAPDPKAAKKDLPIHPKLQKVQAKEYLIDQPLCMFIPHAIALREGDKILVKNSAPIPHSFKWGGDPFKNPGNNVLMPPNTNKTIDDLVADRLPVKMECTIHPWMHGWIRIFNHPYFDVTNENGEFELKNAPAGNYRLVVWHGSCGWVVADKTGQPIANKGGAVTDLGTLKYEPK